MINWLGKHNDDTGRLSIAEQRKLFKKCLICTKNKSKYLSKSIVRKNPIAKNSLSGEMNNKMFRANIDVLEFFPVISENLYFVLASPAAVILYLLTRQL